MQALALLCAHWRSHPHRQGAFMPPAGLRPLNKIPFSPEDTFCLPSACQVLREQGGGGGRHVYPPHSWGRLRAPPGASADTPTQKHPGNGLSPAPPALGASSTAAASGVLEKPLRVPPSGPRWFKGSWAVGRGTLPSWPQISCDLGGGGGLNMSSGSREAPMGLGHYALSR